MSSKDKVSEWRAKLSEDKKQLLREADRERKAKKRAYMKCEGKNAVKKKDKLSKAIKKNRGQVDGRTVDRITVYDEEQANRVRSRNQDQRKRMSFRIFKICSSG